MLWSPVSTAEWSSIGKTVAGSHYLDWDTLRIIGNEHRVWALQNYESTQNMAGYELLSAITLYAIDCREERIRILQSTGYSDYDGRGETALKTTPPGGSEWTYATPGSISATIVRTVCRKDD